MSVFSLLALSALGGFGGCANQPDSFELVPYSETFPASQRTTITNTVKPKTRILFVEDNSGSMAQYQTQLSAGLTNFAQTYVKSDLDLRLAVITTDTYLAHNTSVDAGSYGTNADCLGRLVPGVHDGLLPSVADGISDAFNPDCSLTASALAKLQAKGDRSLRPILSTIPSDGSVADSAYMSQLISDFNKNLFAGTLGNGSERGLQSFYQFLQDNESNPTCASASAADPSCFYSHYDVSSALVLPLNLVVVMSDEHDQSNSDFGSGTTINHTLLSFATDTDAQVRISSAALATTVKTSMDSFFSSLANGATTDPHYAMMGIVNINCNPNLDTTCGLPAGGAHRDPNERWGSEYVALVDSLAGYPSGDPNRLAQPGDQKNLLAANSAVYDINGTDYSPLFTFIGNKIESESKTVTFSSFALKNTPSDVASTHVILNLSNGKKIPISPEWLSLDADYNLLIADQFLSLIPASDAGASISVSYSLRCRGHCAAKK